MKTKAMVVGSLAAFLLIVGVSIFAAGSSLPDDAEPAGDVIGDILREGQDNGQGDMERVMNEECTLDEPQKTQERAKEQLKDGSCEQAGEPQQMQEQTREQHKDGSCDDEGTEDVEEEADTLAAPIHDRDRDQVNGGTGPQYRYGEE